MTASFTHKDTVNKAMADILHVLSPDRQSKYSSRLLVILTSLYRANS